MPVYVTGDGDGFSCPSSMMRAIHRWKHTHCAICGKMLRCNIDAIIEAPDKSGYWQAYCSDHALTYKNGIITTEETHHEN